MIIRKSYYYIIIWLRTPRTQWRRAVWINIVRRISYFIHRTEEFNDIFDGRFYSSSQRPVGVQCVLQLGLFLARNFGLIDYTPPPLHISSHTHTRARPIRRPSFSTWFGRATMAEYLGGLGSESVVLSLNSCYCSKPLSLDLYNKSNHKQ